MRGIAATGLLVGAIVAGCYAPQPPAGAPCPGGECPVGLVCSPATQTCELTGTPVDAMSVDDVPVLVEDSMIDAAPPFMGYSRRLTITNNAGTTLPGGHTIRVSLDLAGLISAGKLQDDFSDLRVVGDGAIGERHRIVDGPGGPAPVAIHFSLAQPLAASASTSVYTIHYGITPAQAPLASGASVFQIYDSFTTGISAAWLSNATPTVTGGKLILSANDVDAIRTNATTDEIPIVSELELVANVPNPASDPTTHTQGTFWYWFGYQRDDFTPTDPWILWIARDKNQIRAEQKSPTGCEIGCSDTDGAQDTAPHHYAIQRDANQTRFYRDGVLEHSVNVTNSTDYSLMIRNFMAASELHVDWVRARPRATPEPSVVVGTEQTP